MICYDTPEWCCGCCNHTTMQYSKIQSDAIQADATVQRWCGDRAAQSEAPAGQSGEGPSCIIALASPPATVRVAHSDKSTGGSLRRAESLQRWRLLCTR